ncbi:hypothetical protein BJY52DRAFT_1188270 [Lactarius psammicola]|nr:hypothetical protein BJY52DRAFT_1188270 [Lactarius psammicola]
MYCSSDFLCNTTISTREPLFDLPLRLSPVLAFLAQLLFITELSPNRLALPEPLTVDLEVHVVLNAPVVALQLKSTASAIEKLISQEPALADVVQASIISFLSTPTINNIMGNLQTPQTNNHPASLLKDVKDIKASILVLQSALTPGPQPGNTHAKSTLPKGRPQATPNNSLGHPISSFAKAAALPP